MHLLTLIIFSSQYLIPIKTVYETVYIFSIYIRVGDFISEPCYSIKEKIVPYIDKMTKFITSLWCGKTSLFRRFEWLVATTVRESERNCKPEWQSNYSRPFTILYVCIISPVLRSSNDVIHQNLSLSSYGESFKLVAIFEVRL